MGRKKDSWLVSIKFHCSNCDKEVEFSKEDLASVSFSGWEAECDCCGGHGGSDASFLCPYCGKWQNVELSSF